MSTHNLCFEQKYEKYRSFLSENFQFLEVNFSIYLNRRFFVMVYYTCGESAGITFDACVVVISPHFASNIKHSIKSSYFSRKTYDAERTNKAIKQFSENAGPDQPAHKRSLIRAFVVRLQNQ